MTPQGQSTLCYFSLRVLASNRAAPLCPNSGGQPGTSPSGNTTQNRDARVRSIPSTPFLVLLLSLEALMLWIPAGPRRPRSFCLLFVVLGLSRVSAENSNMKSEKAEETHFEAHYRLSFCEEWSDGMVGAWVRTVQQTSAEKFGRFPGSTVEGNTNVGTQT